MSNRYKGGIISATPPTLVAGAGASGAWTLEQQMQATAAGLWPQNGPFWIEDVFSTWLYTGNGSTQTINNGIDLSGRGGLVWAKSRNAAFRHYLFDTVRGMDKDLSTNNTDAQGSGGLASATSTGFSFGGNTNGNQSGTTFGSWTFREQPKFFDVLTYTGDGTTNRTVAHNLGAVPGCMIVKRTDASGDWWVYHRSLGATKYMSVNSAGPEATYGLWGDTNPTSTNFTVNFSETNGVGRTYVAYLFAHNAGGFGLSGTDNVISCGSFTGTGSDLSVNLGYEPQWLLIKRASSGTDNWRLYDNMRGMFVNYDDNVLFPNLSNAELEGLGNVRPTATGFDAAGSFPASGVTYIYIAIRRGPMKVPTDGTSVFAPATWTGNNTTGRNIPTGFPVDLTIEQIRTASSIQANLWFDRVRGYSSTITGASAFLRSQVTDAESSLPDYNYVPTMDGFNFGSTASLTTQFNNSGVTAVAWNFRRAPGFFDEVCFSGDGTLTPLNHNLAVAPELVIVKRRSSANGWFVSQYLSAPSYGRFETTAAFVSQGSSYPVTATTFVPVANTSGQTFVAYLFASCPGVSKVGSYTGTGTTQVINCGFTGGARFVLIKRTDSTGDWYVWDTARGMIPANDPYLLLNSAAAEVTGTDFVDTAATGFEITSTAPAAINANGGTFIFLAIS